MNANKEDVKQHSCVTGLIAHGEVVERRSRATGLNAHSKVAYGEELERHSRVTGLHAHGENVKQHRCGTGLNGSAKDVEQQSCVTGLNARSEDVEPQSCGTELLSQGKKEQPRCPARAKKALGFSACACLARALLALGFSVITACASTTKEKILRDMAIASAVGVLIGQSHDVNKDAYSVMYAGTFAAITGAVELIYKDPDAVADVYKKENDKLKLQMDDLLKPKISFQAPGTLNSKIPAKYSHLVNPGEWKVFEIDEWIESSENRIIHQDRIMELIPPTLNPNNQTRSNQ